MEEFMNYYAFLGLIGFVMILFHPDVMAIYHDMRKIAIKSVFNFIFTIIFLWCILPLAIPYMLLYWLVKVLEKYSKNNDE
jgi:hypothetical protein